MAELPERYRPAWARLVDQANRRRVAVEVRILETAPVEDDGTTLRGAFVGWMRDRSGGEPRKIATKETFDEILSELANAIDAEPLPGPDALRTELVAFSRRLAMLRPGDVAKKAGSDLPIYRIFRDRILPLAWDNLVDSVRVEALEDFVRRVGSVDPHAGELLDDGKLAVLVDGLAAEARGLVAPKENVPKVEEPASEEAPAPKPRRRRKAPTDGGS